MTILFAADLDRTLIYSANAVGGDVAGLECVELRDGRPVSFTTARALALLHELAARVAFVPVTSRSLEQYARVRGLPTGRFAVIASGGLVLDGGRPDEGWTRRMQRAISASGEPLSAVAALVEPVARAAWCRSVRHHHDMYMVIRVDREAVSAGWLPHLRDTLSPLGWRAEVQGSKVYVLPEVLDKWPAVQHVAEQVGAELILAAGDSPLDRGMLERADIALRPAHAELSVGSVPPPGTPGVRAAEEIVEAFGALSRAWRSTRTPAARVPDGAGGFTEA